jgi:hypothetical protein
MRASREELRNIIAETLSEGLLDDLKKRLAASKSRAAEEKSARDRAAAEELSGALGASARELKLKSLLSKHVESLKKLLDNIDLFANNELDAKAVSNNLREFIQKSRVMPDNLGDISIEYSDGISELWISMRDKIENLNSKKLEELFKSKDFPMDAYSRIKDLNLRKSSPEVMMKLATSGAPSAPKKIEKNVGKKSYTGSKGELTSTEEEELEALRQKFASEQKPKNESRHFMSRFSLALRATQSTVILEALSYRSHPLHAYVSRSITGTSRAPNRVMTEARDVLLSRLIECGEEEMMPYPDHAHDMDPGAEKMGPSETGPFDAPDEEHPGYMLLGNLKRLAAKAEELAGLASPWDDAEPWIESKVNSAAEHLDAVHDYIMYSVLDQDFDPMEHEEMMYECGEMSGDVLSGDTMAGDMMHEPLVHGRYFGDGGSASMARGQLFQIAKKAQSMSDRLTDDDTLPEWLQSKVAMAYQTIATVSDYMDYKMSKFDMGDPMRRDL